MSAHIHADLMKQYYEDALETDKPWERWEYFSKVDSQWKCLEHAGPAWIASYQYRRKRVALCQVEGRDVFPGDKLWHECEGWVTATKQGCSYNHVCVDETLQILISRLSWTEPARTKTVYQWAFRAGTDWKCSRDFYADQQAAQSGVGFTDVRRLDYTALEVPA